MQKKRIIIQLHHLDQAKPQDHYGIHLAKALEMPVTLLLVERAHYAEMPTAIVGTGLELPPTTSMEELKERAEEKLETFSRKARDVWPYIDQQVAIGFPEPTVLQLSEDEENALLLIDAVNEPSTFNEWFGTYETRVAEGADCPVLVVPDHMPWQHPSKILYIMDMTDAKVENMRTLAKQAKILRADLQVIVIAEKEMNEADDAFQLTANIFRNLLGYQEVTFHRVFGKKRNAQVQDLIASVQPDWFAFEQKNKNFLERIIDDYNTKRLLLESKIPVLVF